MNGNEEGQRKKCVDINVVLLVIVVFYLLSVLADLLIPLVMALLFALLYEPGIAWLCRNKKIPSKLVILFVAMVSLVIIFVAVNLFADRVVAIYEQRELLFAQLTRKMDRLLSLAQAKTGLEFDRSQLIDALRNNWLSIGALVNAAGPLARSLALFGKSFLMFALYFTFLLIGTPRYEVYLGYVGGGESSLIEQMRYIQGAVATYMRIKLVLSLLTGIAAGTVCQLFGIQFALLWGFVSFVLNFVPVIGSIISTASPLLMAFIQFDDLGRFLGLLISLFVLHQLIGNVLEPRVMGNRLRLNTVTIIFGLVFWGYLWGIAGTLFAVPMMVTIKIALERTEGLGVIARIMGYPSETSEKRTVDH